MLVKKSCKKSPGYIKIGIYGPPLEWTKCHVVSSGRTSGSPGGHSTAHISIMRHKTGAKRGNDCVSCAWGLDGQEPRRTWSGHGAPDSSDGLQDGLFPSQLVCHSTMSIASTKRATPVCVKLIPSLHCIRGTPSFHGVGHHIKACWPLHYGHFSWDLGV